MSPTNPSVAELLRQASTPPPAAGPDLLDTLCRHVGYEAWSPGTPLTSEQADELTSELRRAGSNTFATLYRRGEPIPYEEVVDDVVKHVKAEPPEGATLAQKELAVVEKVLGEALDAMPPEERDALWKRIEPSGTVPVGTLLGAGTYLGAAASQQLLYQGAMTAAAYLSRMLLGRALGAGVGVALTRVFGTFFGPVGWAVTAAWLAVDLAGPAYRKTVPGVVTIGAIRASLTTNPQD